LRARSIIAAIRYGEHHAPPRDVTMRKIPRKGARWFVRYNNILIKVIITYA